MKQFRLEIVKMWRELRDPYRPELHYMRGPGPRSLAKARMRTEPEGRASIDAAPLGGKGPSAPDFSV